MQQQAACVPLFVSQQIHAAPSTLFQDAAVRSLRSSLQLRRGAPEPRSNSTARRRSSRRDARLLNSAAFVAVARQRTALHRLHPPPATSTNFAIKSDETRARKESQ